MRKPVTISLSLKFLMQFTKATGLSPTVTIGLSSGMPMLVEYPFEEYGYLRFYLAPKVDDDDTEMNRGEDEDVEVKPDPGVGSDDDDGY